MSAPSIQSRPTVTRGPEYEHGNQHVVETTIDPELLVDVPQGPRPFEDYVIARALDAHSVTTGDLDTGRTGHLGHQHRIVHFERTDKQGAVRHLAVDLHVPPRTTDADPVTAMRFAFEDASLVDQDIDDVLERFELDAAAADDIAAAAGILDKALTQRERLVAFWGPDDFQIICLHLPG